MTDAAAYDSAKVQGGDYLTIRYGNGTQLVYVREAKASRFQCKPKRLEVLRLYGRNYRCPGFWTESKPIWANDGRIICWTTPPAGTPSIPQR